MPQCMCPNCKTTFSVRSSEFGENHQCISCGYEFKLDVIHLAHYQLPNVIRIQLYDVERNPFTRFSVPVMVNYGYEFPPLRSNKDGQIIITKEMFMKAQRDEISTGIMDYRGDYSLNRFIHIKLLDRGQSFVASNSRKHSQWQILDFEKELYGNMRSLVAAYLPEKDIVPTETSIDLAKASDEINLDIMVLTP